MIRFFKSLFGSKKVEEPAVPYKVEAPAQESAPVAVEPRKEVTSVASKPAVPKKQGGAKKSGAPKKQGGSKPKKPKAPKAPKA